MSQAKVSPVGRKTYIDPSTGDQKKGAIVPLAKIRADEIWAQTKQYIDQYEVFGNRLVVAVYIQPQKTESGLYLPDTVLQEDVWQGVTGLVIQKGPGCFIDSDKWKFYGQSVEVGDWITFQPSHTTLCKLGNNLNGRECRIIQDCYVIGRAVGPHVMA